MSDFKSACPRCNQRFVAPEEMLGTWVDCPSCNEHIQLPKSVPETNQPAPQPIAATACSVTDTPSVSDASTSSHRYGGWMAFFYVWLCAGAILTLLRLGLSLLKVVLTYMRRGHYGWEGSQMLLLENVGYFGISLIGLWAGLMLYRRRPRAIRVAQVYLGTLFLWSFISIWFPLLCNFKTQYTHELMSAHGLKAIVTLAFVVAWLLFLPETMSKTKESKREAWQLGMVGGILIGIFWALNLFILYMIANEDLRLFTKTATWFLLFCLAFVFLLVLTVLWAMSGARIMSRLWEESKQSAGVKLWFGCFGLLLASGMCIGAISEHSLLLTSWSIATLFLLGSAGKAIISYGRIVIGLDGYTQHGASSVTSGGRRTPYLSFVLLPFMLVMVIVSWRVISAFRLHRLRFHQSSMDATEVIMIAFCALAVMTALVSLYIVIRWFKRPASSK